MYCFAPLCFFIIYTIICLSLRRYIWRWTFKILFSERNFVSSIIFCLVITSSSAFYLGWRRRKTLNIIASWAVGIWKLHNNFASRDTRFPLVIFHLISYVGELWTSLHCYHNNNNNLNYGQSFLHAIASLEEH